MYQDEYILGFQKALTDHFSLGVRGIYRDLKAAIDDNCDYTALFHAAGFQQDDTGGSDSKTAVPRTPCCRATASRTAACSTRARTRSS